MFEDFEPQEAATVWHRALKNPRPSFWGIFDPPDGCLRTSSLLRVLRETCWTSSSTCSCRQRAGFPKMAYSIRVVSHTYSQGALEGLDRSVPAN